MTLYRSATVNVTLFGVGDRISYLYDGLSPIVDATIAAVVVFDPRPGYTVYDVLTDGIIGLEPIREWRIMFPQVAGLQDVHKFERFDSVIAVRRNIGILNWETARIDVLLPITGPMPAYTVTYINRSPAFVETVDEASIQDVAS